MKPVPERIAEKVETIFPGLVDIHKKLTSAITRAYNDGNTTSKEVFNAIDSVHLIPTILHPYIMDIIVDEIWGNSED